MNPLEKEFVPYPEALELKQLEFDEPCFGWWFTDEEMLIIEKSKKSTSENIIQAPTFSQAFDFFRKYPDWPIESWIQPHLSQNPKQYEGVYWRRGERVSVGVFSTHDEAQLNLLRKLIEIVKNKQK